MIEDSNDGEGQVVADQLRLEGIGNHVIQLCETCTFGRVHQGDVLRMRIVVSYRDMEDDLPDPVLQEFGAVWNERQQFGDVRDRSVARIGWPSRILELGVGIAP